MHLKWFVACYIAFTAKILCYKNKIKDGPTKMRTDMEKICIIQNKIPSIATAFENANGTIEMYTFPKSMLRTFLRSHADLLSSKGIKSPTAMPALLYDKSENIHHAVYCPQSGSCIASVQNNDFLDVIQWLFSFPSWFMNEISPGRMRGSNKLYNDAPTSDKTNELNDLNDDNIPGDKNKMIEEYLSKLIEESEGIKRMDPTDTASPIIILDTFLNQHIFLTFDEMAQKIKTLILMLDRDWPSKYFEHTTYSKKFRMFLSSFNNIASYNSSLGRFKICAYLDKYWNLHTKVKYDMANGDNRENAAEANFRKEILNFWRHTNEYLHATQRILRNKIIKECEDKFANCNLVTLKKMNSIDETPTYEVDNTIIHTTTVNEKQFEISNVTISSKNVLNIISHILNSSKNEKCSNYILKNKKGLLNVTDTTIELTTSDTAIEQNITENALEYATDVEILPNITESTSNVTSKLNSLKYAMDVGITLNISENASNAEAKPDSKNGIIIEDSNPTPPDDSSSAWAVWWMLLLALPVGCIVLGFIIFYILNNATKSYRPQSRNNLAANNL